VVKLYRSSVQEGRRDQQRKIDNEQTKRIGAEKKASGTLERRFLNNPNSVAAIWRGVL